MMVTVLVAGPLGSAEKKEYRPMRHRNHPCVGCFLVTLTLSASPGPAQPVPPLFLGGYGILDLDPFSPADAAILDGLGLFHSPPDAAVTGTGGLYGLTVSIPPALAGLSFDAQFIRPSVVAPNLAFFISNVVQVVLQ
jgi:hypothetical protein